MSWREGRLNDIVTLKRGHDLPESLRVDGSVPVVSSSGITGYHNVPIAAPPGVVTGRYGTLGEVFYLDEPYWPLNTALYAIDFHGNNPRFVAYFLKQTLRRTRSDKAAVPGVNRNDLHEIPVRFPDPSTQERIVGVLRAYDDLIENNRRRIRLLEEAARHLYEEWFVRLCFPGHEHVRIENGVPRGWEPKNFIDVVEVNPKTPIEKGKVSKCVPMSSLSTSGMTVDPAGFEERSTPTTIHFKNGDTLLARITPCLENGKTAFVNFLEEGEAAFGSTEFIVLRGKKVSPYFTYCLARSENLRGCAIKSMIGASGRQRVQESCFNEYPVPLAPESILRSFDSFAEPAFQQIQKLSQANQKLAKSRDLLLPRLMSGEVEV